MVEAVCLQSVLTEVRESFLAGNQARVFAGCLFTVHLLRVLPAFSDFKPPALHVSGRSTRTSLSESCVRASPVSSKHCARTGNEMPLRAFAAGGENQ